jgi:hypothetical protein
LKWAKFKNLKERQKKINLKFLELAGIEYNQYELNIDDDIIKFNDKNVKNQVFYDEYVKLNSCSYYVISATCEKCGTKHFAGFSRCKSRFCLVCNRVRTVKYIKHILDVANLEVNNFYHAVFTLKNYDDLSLMLDDINKYWRHFYNSDKTFRNKFKHRFLGALRTIEIKKGNNSKWHVHMHMLLITDKTFNKDYEFLRDRWKCVTDYKGSVFIKQAKNYKVILEVIKYITNIEKISLNDLADVYLNVKGRRLISCLGILRCVDKNVESDLDSGIDEDINFICRKCGFDKYKLESILYSDTLDMFDLD